MSHVVHDPMVQVSVLQQCLSAGKRPIGLLLGAGCPMAVRGDNLAPLIPDIAGITALVREQLVEQCELRAPFEIAYRQLEADGIETPTVEDLLTHVRALAAVAGSATVRGLSGEQLYKLDTSICDLIHQVVNRELPDRNTPYHRVAIWANAILRDSPIEIFTTNYDLLVEQALEEARVPYFDGFPGARKPLFDPSAIEQDSPLPNWTRLWKIHGSINWYQGNNLEVFRGTATESGRRRVIHPSHLKYQESRRMPYLALFDRMRTFLRVPTAALVTCGYSFRDEHINETIVQGLQHTQTAVVFALMFDNIDDCVEVVDLAKQRPNLNVLARDGGIIGGRQAKWVKQDSETLSEIDSGAVNWTLMNPTEPNGKLRAEFLLGDFQVFGQFLQQQVGDDQRRQGGVGSV